jgi:hypothetical protein
VEQEELFGFDIDCDNNACVGWDPDGWRLYTRAFQRAAEVLAEHVLTKSTDQDVLVYPIVFLSRHQLELQLKRALLDAQELSGRERKLPVHHRIHHIWQELRPMVVEMFPTEDHSELRQLDSLITAIADLDPQSSTFRYPVDKTEHASLPGSLRYINIRRYRERFEAAALLLSGIQTGLRSRIARQRSHESAES